MLPDFARRFRKTLREQKVSRTNAAKLLKVSLSQIWNYVNGKELASLKVLKRMCEIFHISADYLLDVRFKKDGIFDAKFVPTEVFIEYLLQRKEVNQRRYERLFFILRKLKREKGLIKEINIPDLKGKFE